MKKIMTAMALSLTLVWCQNWQPVYELFNPGLGDHFYTMNLSEVTQAENSMGYSNHGPKYKWSSISFGTGIPIYRLWNNSDHFYTTSVTEKDNCISSGYVDEGIVGYLSPNSSGNLVAWYRYYHSQWDDHAYPVDQADITVLYNAGYYSEGIHGYVVPMSDEELPNEAPNAIWNCELYSEYNYEEITFAWQGVDDNDSEDDLWYHVQLSGNNSFDFWTPNNYLHCWPGIGNHTLTITARDLDDAEDETPLIHNFTTIGRSPEAPSNLHYAITDDNHIVIYWDSFDDLIVGFTIWRDYNTELANLSSLIREYEDDTVELGETYRYVVVAYNNYGWTESQPLYVSFFDEIGIRADRFDFPIGYPDYDDDWYDAQPFGSVLADPVLFHSGNDFNKLGGDLGESIYAPADGLIVYANDDAAGWGRCMITKHQSENNRYFVFPDGSRQSSVYFLYAHLNSIDNFNDIIPNETEIQRGDRIATIGNTGSATGPHLHMECWSNMSDGYPLGYGYYEDLPNDKYDVMEYISMNRQVNNSYDLFVHTFNEEFVVLTDNWQINPGAQELQWVPLGYNNYLLSANTNQNETARWELKPVLVGNYTVSVYIPNRHYTSTNAHYVLQRDGYANEDIYVNGASYSNEWYELGNYDFTANTDNYLYLYSASDVMPIQEVSADAVHLHYLDDIGGVVSIDENPLYEKMSFIGYPNPFNDRININYHLSTSGRMSMIVYSILGKQVKVLINDYIEAGDYTISWQTQNIASGIYLVAMRTQNEVQTLKVNYIR